MQVRKYCPKCKKDYYIELSPVMKCPKCGMTLNELNEIIGNKEQQDKELQENK